MEGEPEEVVWCYCCLCKHGHPSLDLKEIYKMKSDMCTCKNGGYQYIARSPISNLHTHHTHTHSQFVHLPRSKTQTKHTHA